MPEYRRRITVFYCRVSADGCSTEAGLSAYSVYVASVSGDADFIAWRAIIWAAI